MKRILVIDYDQALLASLHKTLTDEGYMVVLAADGKIGWEKYEVETPDLVLMEAMLSKIHGFELCEKITKHSRKKVPVFMMTGVYRDRVYRTEALRTYGASLYLEKPIDIPELLSSIRATIGPGERLPAADEIREAETPPQTGPVNGRNRTLEAPEVLVQNAVPIKGARPAAEAAKDTPPKSQPGPPFVSGPGAAEARGTKTTAGSKESPKTDVSAPQQAKPAAARPGASRPAHEPSPRRSGAPGAGLREIEALTGRSPAPVPVKPPVSPIPSPRVAPAPDPIEEKTKDILAETGFILEKGGPSPKKTDAGSEDIDKLLKSTLADFDLGAEKKRPVEKPRPVIPPAVPAPARTAAPPVEAKPAPVEVPPPAERAAPVHAEKFEAAKSPDQPTKAAPAEMPVPPAKVPPQQIRRTAPEPEQAKIEPRPVAPSKPVPAPAAVPPPFRPAATQAFKPAGETKPAAIPPAKPAAKASPTAQPEAPKPAAPAPAAPPAGLGKRPAPPGAGPTITLVGLEEKDVVPAAPASPSAPATPAAPIASATIIAPITLPAAPPAAKPEAAPAPKPPAEPVIEKRPPSPVQESPKDAVKPEPVRSEKKSTHEAGSRIFRDIYEPEKKKSSPLFLGIGIAVVAVAAVAFLIFRPKPASRMGSDMAATPAQTDISQAPTEVPVDPQPQPKTETPKPAPVKPAAPAAQDAVVPAQMREAPKLMIGNPGAKPAAKAEDPKADPAAASGGTKQPEAKPAETPPSGTVVPTGGAAQTETALGTENRPAETAVQPPTAPKAKPGELVDITTVDVQPKVLKSVNPIYPAQALRNGKEGTITVNALVDDAGNVIDTGIIKGLQDDMGMEKAALAAVKKWKFQPAVKDGVKVRVWKVVNVTFRVPRSGTTSGQTDMNSKEGA